ncbi:alpha/beta hydrolase [Nocardia sp. NPDC004123]
MRPPSRRTLSPPGVPGPVTGNSSGVRVEFTCFLVAQSVSPRSEPTGVRWPVALEFPSWLEWLSWLVGSEWPHGNEDTMWQMARDLESVAGQADDLLQDLDHLLGALDKAYPDGTGGEEIIKWLKPLRYGDDSGHGSVKEFGDNYRQLSTAADGFGDQLQSAKLNFYIAGGWLLGELAWAAATGPFAPESEAAVFASARIAFRELGEGFVRRIESMIEGRITNALLKQVLPKLIYEIGQGAVTSVIQSTAQELLVESIQNLDGHGHGFDWGAIGKNALVAGLSGGAGGAIGFGANHALPTEMGGWKGAFNGALTGATAGVGGAGAGWLANGLVNGDWSFDPRSMTGGAFGGAGPSGLHGYNGDTNHNGPMRGHDTGDGSTHLPGETTTKPATFDQPGTTPDGHTPGADANGNGHNTAGDPSVGQHGTPADPNANGQHGTPADPNANGQHGTPADPSANGQHGNPGDSTGERSGDNGQQAGGPQLHAASAPTAAGPAPVDHAHDQQADHGGDSNRSDNNGSFTSDGRRERLDANAQDNGGATDSPSQRSADTQSVGDHSGSPSGDAARPDASGTPEHRAGDATAAMDPARTHDTGVDARTPESVSDHTSDPSSGANSTTATNFSNDGTTRADGEPAKGATTSSTHGAPGEARAPAGDPAKSPVAPRDPLRTPTDGSTARPADGTAPKPTDGSPPRTPDTRAGVDRATRPDAPVQATRTGVEPTAPRAEPVSTGDHEQHVDAHASGPNDFLNLSGEPTRPGDHHESPGDHADSPNAHPDGATILPIPVDPPQHADRNRPADSRGYNVAAAGPVGDFHGDARTEGDLTPDVVHKQIQDNLRLIAPEGVAWNPDENHFVLSNGRIVRIEVGETSNGHVAEFEPSADGYDVRVSNKARNEDVVRALAHEMAEIRLSQDDDILIDRRDDRPTRMSTHLGGRFAELRTLTAHVDRAVMDPARAAELPGLRHDLHDLMDHLGFHDPAHAPTVERLLAAHDPDLAHRIALEQAGVLSDRPTFNQHLTEDEFQHAAENHLARLRELMAGEHAGDLLRAEEQGLNGRMREELSRRLFERLFEEEARPARGQVPGLLKALNPINAAINHPTLRGPEQAAAIHRAIDGFHDGMPRAARDALGPERFAQMHAAADAFATAPDRITATIDHATGRMDVGGEHTTLTDFLRGIDRANRAAAEHGLNIEYTVVLHDAVDGLSTVEVMPRPQPQHRLPLEQYRFGEHNEPIERQPRPSVPAAAAGGHTIDVGVGRGAFAVEMTPAADRAGGGLIIKTELADAAIGAQRRRDLGLLDAGPLMEPGTVMVYGDMLGNGHLLGGDIARVFINNVSAKLPDAAYHAIAGHLSEILAPGGRVEIQWDMKPDKVGGDPGTRYHILGTKLWEALEGAHREGANPFKLIEEKDFEHPGNRDYYYTIDAGGSNKLPHERMAEYSPPQPEHRWTISYEPDAPGTHEHGNASPIGDFHGDAREGTEHLQPEFVHEQIRENLGHIAPEDVVWNHDEQHFRLPDGRTVDVRIGATKDGNVAEFHARADGSGYEVVLSERARDVDVPRALAHELAEIRLAQDPHILVDPHNDRPSTMTSHLGGRFAEMRVLTEHIDRANADPAHAHELPRLRRDLRELAGHLGMHDPTHADTVRRLLTEHDAQLAHRYELEEQGGHDAGHAHPNIPEAYLHPQTVHTHDHEAAPTTTDTKPLADLNEHPGGIGKIGELIATVDGRPVEEHVDKIARERAAKIRAAADEFSQQPGEKPVKTQKRVAKAQADGTYVGPKSHGNVTAAVVDLRTGIAYEGINGKQNEVVPKDERHPTLQANIDAMKAAGLARPEGGYPNLSRDGRPESKTYPGYPEGVRPYPHFDRPWGHAEVKAANAALWARERANLELRRQGRPEMPTGPEALGEMYSQTYKPFEGDAPKATPYCANCNHSMGECHNFSGRYADFPSGPENLVDEFRPSRSALDPPGGPSEPRGLPPTAEPAHPVEASPTGEPVDPAAASRAEERTTPIEAPHADPPAEHGTASPVGEFRGDARPAGMADLTLESVVGKVEGNLRLIEPEGVAWNHDTGRFEMTHDGRPIDITVGVGPTTDNAVAEFRARTDESGHITGYDVKVSPHARDEDVVRAVAHELAEIRLAQDENVVIDPVDDRPTRMTSHLGGRFAELRVLVEQIGEGVAERVKPNALAPLRRDLNDLMYHLGLHDPEHAPTVERLLAQHDPDLARLIDQARIPDPGILRPGPVDHDAAPTAHDLGRIRQLHELAERLPEGHDETRREALALVEQLGLREGTPGAAERRAIVAEHLGEHARNRVDELLADVGRPDTELSAADREHVETVRLERRAADALDFLSIPTHGAVMKTHIEYRREMAGYLEHLREMADHPAQAHETGGPATDSGPIRLVGDHHTVEDVRTGERWFRWPPGTEEYPAHTPVPEVGLPTDPDHRLPTDPAQLHEAWQHLSPEEKDAWHHADPFIGNRDGIPHADRDRYNRQTLEMLRHQTEQDMLRAQAEPETPHTLAERKLIKDRLDIIRDIRENYLDLPTKEGMPEVHLAYIDEKLQYIYALGDPDTADHVVVEIAGAFRRRSGVGYALETLAQVRQAALAIDPHAETSVILFGAYNNPNSLIQAMHSEHAEGGAAKVREFHDGLRVTHQGPPANITTFAHSYGAVTAGHAAGHGHELNTDALVFIGSFGTGVTNVGDLRLTGVDPAETGDHVFATLAEYDSLVMMPPTHGPAPTDPEFGARVFESGTTPSRTRLGWNPDDHGGKNYFNSNHQPSWDSLGLIITGRTHLLG